MEDVIELAMPATIILDLKPFVQASCACALIVAQRLQREPTPLHVQEGVEQDAAALVNEVLSLVRRRRCTTCIMWTKSDAVCRFEL